MRRAVRDHSRILTGARSLKRELLFFLNASFGARRTLLLIKTAMALLPAASLVGAAPLALATSLVQSRSEERRVGKECRYCQENAYYSKCRGDPAAYSRAKERS